MLVAVGEIGRRVYSLVGMHIFIVARLLVRVGLLVEVM
jgi:hypothetical protein